MCLMCIRRFVRLLVGHPCCIYCVCVFHFLRFVWWVAPLGKLSIPPHMETGLSIGLSLKPRPKIPPTPVSSKTVLKKESPLVCLVGGTHRMIHINTHIKPRTAPRRPTPASAAGGGPARCAHSALASFRPGVASGHAPLRATLCARDTRHAAGPVSRLSSFEPGDKTGLRLSPHLAPAHY